MKVLICGGARTMNIVKAIKPKLSVGSVDLLVEEDVENIESLFTRGEYFDRAILIEQGITNDGYYNTEQQIRDRLYNFVKIMNEHGVGNSTFILVTGSEIMARLMYEETLDIVEQTKIVIQTPPFTIAFFSTLVLRDLSDITDGVYEYDVLNTGNQESTAQEILPDDPDTDEEGGQILSRPPDYTFPTEDDGGDTDEDPFNDDDDDKDPFDADGDPFGDSGDPFESNGDTFESNGDPFDTGFDSGIDSDIEVEPDVAGEPTLEGGIGDQEGDDWGSDEFPDTDGVTEPDIASDTEFDGDTLDTDEDPFGEDVDEDPFGGDPGEEPFGGDEDTFGEDIDEDTFDGGQSQFGEAPITEPEDIDTKETQEDIDSKPDSFGEGDPFDDFPEEMGADNTGIEVELDSDQEDVGNDIDDDFNPQELFEPDFGEPTNPDELTETTEAGVDIPESEQSQDDNDLETVEDLFKADTSSEDAIREQFRPSVKEQEITLPSAPITPIQPTGIIPKMGKRAGKNAKQQAQAGFISTPAHNAVPTSDIDQLRGMLNTFRTRGSSLVITGASSSGKSTLAYNITNIIVKLGYTALLVDMDTRARTQAYISKQAYECVHSVDPSNASLRQALNTSNTTIGGYVNIISPGFHILTMGLAGDALQPNKLAPSEKLGRFANAVRNQYNFIIYDMPFDVATNYAKDMTFTADNVILSVDHSNHGLMNLLIEMCNIENEDMQELMFRTSQICFTKAQKLAKVFGRKVTTLKDILRVMDAQVLDLIGEQPDYLFSEMRICGQIPLDMRYEQCWMEKQQVSDTPDGLTMYAELLRKVLLNK